MAYEYDGSYIERERVLRGHCHCKTVAPAVRSLAAAVVDGQVLDEHGQPLSTGPIGRNGNQKYIFAVKNQELRFGPDGTRGDVATVKHETLFHNQAVDAAGEIQFRDGRVVDINDHSMTYQTAGHLLSGSAFAMAVMRALTSVGVQLAPGVLAVLEATTC